MAERTAELIRILLRSQKPLTEEEIASQLDVTGRTIRSDLNKIEESVNEHGCVLCKKPHVGVWIEGPVRNQNELYLSLGNTTAQDATYSKEYRINYILGELFVGKGKAYVRTFAQHLYVSKATIDKDLAEVSKWLKKHKLELVKPENQAMYIRGEEKDFRSAISILANNMDMHHLSIASIFPDYSQEEEKVKEIVLHWSKEENLDLDDVNINNLVFHICVMNIRVRKNASLPEANTISWENKAVSSLVKQIEETCSIKLGQGEFDWLAMHVIGIMLEKGDIDKSPLVDDLKQTASKISADFIANLEKIIPLGFDDSDAFKQSLYYHLLSMVYRLKYGLNLYNPLLREIKTNYTSSFSIASIINSSLEKYLGVKAKESEIAYIAIHISVVVESKNTRKQVAVVCALGVGVSKLLKLRLEKNFPDVHFIDAGYQDKEILEQVDLVVFAANEITTKKPHLKISPLLPESDVEKIQKALWNLDILPNETFSNKTVIYRYDEVTKKEILKDLSWRLKELGCVESTFYEGVLKREEMGSTEVGNGIVLTHGFHSDVKHTQFAFCKLKEGIVWNTEKCDFIVLLAIEKKDAKDVMKMEWLYQMLMKEKVISQIRNCKDGNALYEILKKESGYQ